MSRIAYVILCSCLITFAGFGVSSVNAGDYDDGDYVDVVQPPRRPARVWYSSTCCYLKVERHVGHRSQVRYVRVQDTEHHTASREPERPSKYVNHAKPPSHYKEYNVVVSEKKPCHRRKVRVLGANGSAVWALTAKCY